MVISRKVIVAAAVLVVALFFGQREYYRSHNPSFPSRPASAAANGPCVDFRQAASHAGENGCVSGYVLRAYTSKSGNTFLDFCQDYRTCAFTSVVFASDRSKFGNLGSLDGRKVNLHGLITIYNNQTEIIVHDPWQIQVSQ
ncbi:MAG: hypothetical protein KGM47_13585 [Acidobacteriota bacterium]|nr:hypothetical protein [Acidobacteriota bacterium]